MVRHLVYSFERARLRRNLLLVFPCHFSVVEHNGQFVVKGQLDVSISRPPGRSSPLRSQWQTCQIHLIWFGVAPDRHHCLMSRSCSIVTSCNETTSLQFRVRCEESCAVTRREYRRTSARDLRGHLFVQVIRITAG